VTDEATSSRQRLHGRQRTLAALLGVGLLCPLAVAAFLQPDRRGHGTHQQLGLPPCSCEVMFGVPCPSCGSTTAFAHTVRGQLPQAVQANAGGTLLVALFALSGPWLLLSAARGRWLVWVPSGPRVALIAAAIATVMVIDWIFRLCSG
jgi:hypothetical protein